MSHNFITRSVPKVSRILNFRGLHTFDFRFFVALCWYSYPSHMPTSSVILNVQLIFHSCFAWMCFGSSSIFASSISGTRKVTGGPDLENTVATGTLLCCFWPKFAHKRWCVSRGVVMVQKSIFVLPQIWAFLADCIAQIAQNLQVILLIDSSTVKFLYRTFDPFFGTGKNRRRAKTRPSKIAVTN